MIKASHKSTTVCVKVRMSWKCGCSSRALSSMSQTCLMILGVWRQRQAVNLILFYYKVILDLDCWWNLWHTFHQSLFLHKHSTRYSHERKLHPTPELIHHRKDAPLVHIYRLPLNLVIFRLEQSFTMNTKSILICKHISF